MTQPFQLQVAETVDAAKWDEAVSRLGGAVFHSSVWARYIQARHGNIRPLFARYTAGEETPVGVALMFLEISPRRVLAPLTGALWTEAAPAMRPGDSAVAAAFAKALVQYARSRRVATMSVGSFGGNAGMTAFSQCGFHETRYWEFVLDLSATEDDIWNRMEYKRRKNIRKAERMGVVLEDHCGEDGIAELRQLQGASSQRIVARGGRDITHSGERRTDPVNILLDAGIGRIVCAKVDGQVVSAGLFTHFNGTVYHTLSGHSEEALRSQAPTLLLWETIKRYKAEGARRLNFGGCSAAAIEKGHSEHGVYAYKKDFGGDCIECVTFNKVLFPMRHRAGVLLKRVALGLSRR
jgi:CelD/BcsL family acetyltransferase involved in cellulose biosynthesis